MLIVSYDMKVIYLDLEKCQALEWSYSVTHSIIVLTVREQDLMYECERGLYMHDHPTKKQIFY